MMPRNLPEAVKQKCIDILKKHLVSASNTKIRQFGDSKFHYDLLIKELQQEGDFGMFLRNDTRINIIRNEHWKDFNPWLFNEIQPYFEDTQLEPGQLDYLRNL